MGGSWKERSLVRFIICCWVLPPPAAATAVAEILSCEFSQQNVLSCCVGVTASSAA